MARLVDLVSKIEREGAIVAGVLSGTSADGIDVAIARMRAVRDREGSIELATPELVAFEVLPFGAELGERVRRVLDGAPSSLRELALLDRDLGRAFGRAARDVARANELALDLVGSHGQTVWHHDGAESSGPATMQLGDGDHVAEECATIVASDFRRRDVAAGGEGAPLSALADPLVFARAPRPCFVLNLGGMANLTWLGRDARNVLAFDTGPANSLLDGLARALFERAYDEDGALAAGGTADEALVAELLAHPFFERAPPKSTGRDTFGAPWVASVLERASARASSEMNRAPIETERARRDVLASGVELVARSVALALDRFVPERTGTLLVAGGGVHNATLMRALERATGVACRSSAEAGVPPDAREGLVFAVLAARCALELPSTSERVTGARAGRVLGKLSFGTSA